MWLRLDSERVKNCGTKLAVGATEHGSNVMSHPLLLDAINATRYVGFRPDVAGRQAMSLSEEQPCKSTGGSSWRQQSDRERLP
jgi:hypothetical protein